MRVLRRSILKATSQVTIAGVLCIVAGCAGQVPRTGYTPTAAAVNAPDPTLLTVGQLAQRGSRPEPAAETESPESLAARAQAVQARARALSRPVLTPSASAQLTNAACRSEAPPATCPTLPQ